MKYYFVVLATCLLLGCNSDDDTQNNCNFLLNTGVNLSVNLNLPQFTSLQISGASLRVEGQGNGGIILARVGSALRAWDGADPNVPVSACSILQVNGLVAISSCDEPNQYSLSSGQDLGENPEPCGLQPYRVETVGDNQFLISN